MNAAPAVARLVRPEDCPLGTVLRCACEGLRALGLYPYAESIEYARACHPHLVGAHLGKTIDALDAARRVLETVSAPPSWLHLADETRRLLRDAELRVR